MPFRGRANPPFTVSFSGPSCQPSSVMRRHYLALAGATVLGAWCGGALAATGLGSFSNADMTSALRAALEKGAGAAVAQLGKANGFLGDDRFRIPLPEGLRQGERLLRLAGRGDDLDRLVEMMNRAAEMAVSQAKPLLLNAVRSMSVTDARAILTGGEDSVTQYFRDKTREPLTVKFLPIVDQSVNKVGLARQYNALAEKAGVIGLVKGEAASVQQYVTARALDALYATLAEQERQIRDNPVAAGSKIISRVFGAMH